MTEPSELATQFTGLEVALNGSGAIGCDDRPATGCVADGSGPAGFSLATSCC